MIFAFLNYHTVDYYFTLLFCLCQYIYLILLSHNSTSVNGSRNTNIFNHIPAVVKCCKDRIDIIFFSISSKYVNFSDEITLPALAATELEKFVAQMQRKTGISANKPIGKNNDVEKSQIVIDNDLFDDQMRAQLDSVFKMMEKPLILKLYLDQRPVSQELESFTEALVSLTDKLSIAVESRQSSQDIAPCVKLCRTDGTETGLGFHGVPGGHEFTSFILGLYNAAGPGQTLDIDTKREIEEIRETVNFKILVTLSCTMCPDLVIAAQRMASINPMITAEVYDIHHFEELKNKHQVMSVPCLVINDTTVSFGKKNLRQLIDLIKTSKLE